MACIGLTIPAIAIASIWLPMPLKLGLAPVHIVLLGLTFLVTMVSIVPGRVLFGCLIEQSPHLRRQWLSIGSLDHWTLGFAKT
jgi:hypothetical protein